MFHSGPHSRLKIFKNSEIINIGQNIILMCVVECTLQDSFCFYWKTYFIYEIAYSLHTNVFGKIFGPVQCSQFSLDKLNDMSR